MKGLLLVPVLFAVSVVGQAADDQKQEGKEGTKPAMTEPKKSKEFELLKGLAGGWKGETEMGGKRETATTTFRVTSGGSAVVETMGAGTQHEMTNVYHDVDGKLMMTHYCAMGNAPLLKVAKSGDKSIEFEAVKANGIDPEKTPHMHSLVYSMPGSDQLVATWTSKNMGKEHEAPTVIKYSRVE